jgi:hypothetical protein
MRLFCWYCHKSVSSELQGDTIFRAVAVCPECIAKSDESAQLQRAVDGVAESPVRGSSSSCDCGKRIVLGPEGMWCHLEPQDHIAYPKKGGEIENPPRS